MSAVVEIELAAVEQDIEALDQAILKLLDVAFTESNAREAVLAAVEKIHEASFSLRTWINIEAREEPVKGANDG